MKSLLKITAIISIAAFCSVLVAAEKVATDGAVPGKWTQDYEAAIAVAKTNDLPVMLNFTGSDWCGWCKLMDKSVFAKEEWKSWAADNIVLVQLNFPNDKSLVPEKYVKRNSQLAQVYGIRGYPTYVVLGSDGKSELGRLGADRNATPGKFISDIEELLVTWRGIDKYLSPEEYKEYSKVDEAASKKAAQAEEFYQNGLAALKNIHSRETSAKTDKEKKAAHDEFAAKKADLEKEMKKYIAETEDALAKREKFIKKALKEMHKGKKGSAK